MFSVAKLEMPVLNVQEHRQKQAILYSFFARKNVSITKTLQSQKCFMQIQVLICNELSFTCCWPTYSLFKCQNKFRASLVALFGPNRNSG